MAFRADISVDWDASPRIVTVAAPSAEVSCQDLYDTLRTLEASSEALDSPAIVEGEGKGLLLGGVQNGLTVTLLDALLAFEDRAGPTVEQVLVSGGNLVSLNSGSYVSPIAATAFTQPVVAASVSATITGGAGGGLSTSQETALYLARDYAAEAARNTQAA